MKAAMLATLTVLGGVAFVAGLVAIGIWWPLAFGVLAGAIALVLLAVLWFMLFLCFGD